MFSFSEMLLVCPVPPPINIGRQHRLDPSCPIPKRPASDAGRIYAQRKAPNKIIAMRNDRLQQILQTIEQTPSTISDLVGKLRISKSATTVLCGILVEEGAIYKYKLGNCYIFKATEK